MKKLSDAQSYMLEGLFRSPKPTCHPGDGCVQRTIWGLVKRGFAEIKSTTYNRVDGIECWVITDAGLKAIGKTEAEMLEWRSMAAKRL